MKITYVEAIAAQSALNQLGELEIPIKISLDIAIISNLVDEQIKAYSMVLKNLCKKYSIKAEPKVEGGVTFVCTETGQTEGETEKIVLERLEEFGEKFAELLETKTEDLTFHKAKLPVDIDIKPALLKPLVNFVEIE